MILTSLSIDKIMPTVSGIWRSRMQTNTFVFMYVPVGEVCDCVFMYVYALSMTQSSVQREIIGGIYTM